VNLRVYRDLERGWRVKMPNLEQTGMLKIGYLGLDGAAGNAALWEKTASALWLGRFHSDLDLTRIS